MKKGTTKLLSLIITIMMFTMLLPGQAAKAAITPDGMFYYSVFDGNATIMGLVNKAYTGPLTIPSTISDGPYKYNVTAIDSGAFGYCNGLTGPLTMPDSVTSIGDNAFTGCSGLTILTIGNSVTSIGFDPFYGCSSLIDIYVSNINKMYSSINGILYDKMKSKLIRCPSGKAGLITIPDSVTSIGSSAFLGCSGLTGTLTIPNSVTSIGSSAFEGCSGLTGTLTIPDSVTSIGKRPFDACSGLSDIIVSNENRTYSSVNGILYDRVQRELIRCPEGKVGQITIPDSVTSIGDMAFWNCSGLTGPLTIPDSVTSIAGSAFYGCNGLSDINVSNENTTYSTINGILYDKVQSKLIQCPEGKVGQVNILDSVTSIGSGAFRNCSSLTGDLAIPDSLTSIGSSAFSGCSGLTGDLAIPDSVTSIGGSAFSGCSGLTGTLTIPDSVTSIRERTFDGCSGLAGLTIGNSVMSIGWDAFNGCSGLTGTLTIPNSVMSIGWDAFNGCNGLTGILTIPNGVISIGDSAFEGCSGFTGPLTIPDSVTSIGSGAFYGCSGLTELIIGSGVTSIGYRPFDACSGLSDIIVSNLNTKYSSINGILYDRGQKELIRCPEGRVGQITIPDSVTSIGGSAFSGCSGLTGTLTIPDSVTSIRGRAFDGCSGLSGLTIGNGVTTIYGAAFESCKAIKKITVKPVNAPMYYEFDEKTQKTQPIGIPYSAVLYTPTTPSDNTSYNVEPWSLFVRGTLQPTAEVVSGVNRFDTAALISKRLNDSANTVILTTGRNFPDALSAGPLAVQKNAPILLAEVNKIPIETLNEINRLGASKVIILGGLGAMDSSVEATLKNLGLSVERISGATRFLTAIETAKQVRASSGQLDRAILANGYGFADALSIGSYAAKAGIPILLTAANSLSPETKTAMVQFGIKEIDIIGGELAVSKAVESELQAMGITVSRISGASRFATSVAIAGTYFATSVNAIVSNGTGFVDALAAVPLAVKQNAPILLVEKDSLPVVMSNYLGSSSIKNITITGGELAVSSTVKNQILNILNSGGQ